MKRLWLIGIGGVGALILAGMIGVGLFGNPEALHEFNFRDELWIVRYTGYFFVFCFWWFIAPGRIVPRVVDNDGQESQERRNKQKGIREMIWKLAIFVVVFEVVVVQKIGMN
jgi:hypothetical protein